MQIIGQDSHFWETGFLKRHGPYLSHRKDSTGEKKTHHNAVS